MDPIQVHGPHDKEDPWFGIFFHIGNGEVKEAGEHLRRAGHAGLGYCWESVAIALLEGLDSDPEWIDELQFDSENSAFCVRAGRRGPVEELAKLMNAAIAEPTLLTAAARRGKCLFCRR